MTLVTLSVLAAAQVLATTTIAPSWRAPDECPQSAAPFVAATRARRADLVVGDGQPVDVRIERTPQGLHGTLAFGGTTRTADAGSCGDLVEALALMASIALLEDPPGAAPPAPSAPVAPSTPPSPSAAASPTTADLEPARPAAPPSSGRPRSVSWGAGFDATALLIPGFANAIAMGGTVEARVRGPGLSPWIALGFARSYDASVSTLEGGAARWTLGRLALCPHALSTREWYAVAPCATAAGGVLEVASAPFGSVEARGRPWISLGLAARATAHGGPFFVSLQLGAATPMVRDGFAAQRAGLEARPPALFGEGSILAGLLFS